MNNDHEIYATGEKIVVPTAGLCEVKGRTKKSILGRQQWYYALRSLQAPLTLLIPCARVRKFGARRMMSAAQMRDVLDGPVQVGHPIDKFHLRYPRWLQALRSGELGVRRQVLVEMNAVPRGQLRAEELQLEKFVKLSLATEVQQALGVDPATTEKLIRRATTVTPLIQRVGGA